MKFLDLNKKIALSPNLAIQDQPIFWQYLQKYPKMNGFKLYMPLSLSLFFTVYYGCAYYFSFTQHINILNHQNIYEWVQQPIFIVFWLISIFSPLILFLKTQTVFQWRYVIALLILMHAYPLFLYGIGFATAIFLCSVLSPLLFEYELGKSMS